MLVSDIIETLGLTTKVMADIEGGRWICADPAAQQRFEEARDDILEKYGELAGDVDLPPR